MALASCGEVGNASTWASSFKGVETTFSRTLSSFDSDVDGDAVVDDLPRGNEVAFAYPS